MKWNDKKFKHMRADFQIKILSDNISYKKALAQDEFSM